MTVDPAPDRRFATCALALATLVWVLALAVAARGLLVGLAIAAVAALVLLARAAADDGRAAIVAGLLTVALGIAAGRTDTARGGALAVAIVAIAAALLLAVPQLDDHARWKARHRAPAMPRARVRR